MEAGEFEVVVLDSLELVGLEEGELQTGKCGEGAGEVGEDDKNELLEGMALGYTTFCLCFSSLELSVSIFSKE